MSTSWENNVKQGVYAPLWGITIFPWELTLTWQYINPTVIVYTNEVVNTPTWANEGKSAGQLGTLIGFPFGLTYQVESINWTNQSKS